MTENTCRLERLFYCLISALVVLAVPARCAEPNKTIISDTIYRADGTPARGTLLISWPAFSSAEALTNRDIVDEGKFKDGLGKIIDGTVQCLNASAWANAK